ncbi:MAG: hypothetical protein ABR924_16165 [Terracidiphilus sp.]|jgi:hypothetical protein
MKMTMIRSGRLVIIAAFPAGTAAIAITNWRRFSLGLWRVPRSEIANAFSLSVFPKVILFTHEGRLFTNGDASCLDCLSCA